MRLFGNSVLIFFFLFQRNNEERDLATLLFVYSVCWVNVDYFNEGFREFSFLTTICLK